MIERLLALPVASRSPLRCPSVRWGFAGYCDRPSESPCCGQFSGAQCWHGNRPVQNSSYGSKVKTVHFTGVVSTGRICLLAVVPVGAGTFRGFAARIMQWEFTAP